MSNDPFAPSSDSDSGKVFQFEFRPEDTGLIPVGLYEARVINMEESVSKNSGNPMLIWDFIVHEGEFAGKELRLWTTLKPGATWMLDSVLSSFGLMNPIDSETASRHSKEFTVEDVRGLLCGILIEHTEYRGQVRNSIKEISSSNKGVGARWSIDDSSSPFDPPETTDDIPF